jgi:adenylyltransferase/sulfurtransferase
MNNNYDHRQYKRQLILKELGKEGQDKLRRAKVLVVGAGGLGCPALQYITAAGVGTIGIVDFDLIDISNLHRQVLYTFDDIGKPKAETAAAKLRTMNPDAEILVYPITLTKRNALEIIAGFDLIIDGTDNLTSRYLINDTCVSLGKPFVFGAVWQFEGQIGVFNLSNENEGYTSNYRDLFPNPPDPSTSPSCIEAGVLGVLPGIIGTLQATEAIKIITGIGKPLANKILTYSALHNSFYEFHISPVEKVNGLMPSDENEFRNFDYESK